MNVVVIDTVDAEPLPAPSFASTALAWGSRHTNTIGMVGLALVSLLMLRSVAKSKGDDDGAGQPVLKLDAQGNLTPSGDEDDEDDDAPRLTLRKDETLKDDLAEIVRGDPDAAAAILRGWIGKAS